MRVITLTTDFGTQDHYVAAMKGVILSLAGRVSIIDVSHGPAPYQIEASAYLIGQVWKTFPKRTVHLVVVDPGVGSERRPILVEAGEQYFVAPDNGVLSLIYAQKTCAQNSTFRVRHITNTRYFGKSVSQTFHGRDVFAPLAAHLSKGEIGRAHV